jgi:peroxiredoxin
MGNKRSRGSGFIERGAKKVNAGICFLVLLFLGFSNASGQELPDIRLKTIDNKDFSLRSVRDYKASVFITMDPDCPLCKNYSLTLRNLQAKYGDSVRFYGIFPGNYYKKEEIRKFAKDIQLKVTILLDDRFLLTRHLKASVTPEVFVLNKAGTRIYSGKIDNWVVSISKKRAVITEHYLDDALNSVVNDRAVKVSRTTAIGCIIEY